MTKKDQLGNFELMVMLAFIRLGDNAYGVPISEELEKRTGRDVAIGSVYAALERLEAIQCSDAHGGRHFQLPFLTQHRRSIAKPQSRHWRERKREIELLSCAASAWRYRAGSSRAITGERRRYTVHALGGSRIYFAVSPQ